MSEMTRIELVAEFCKMAEGASPNSGQSLAAQVFFKRHLIGMTEKDARNSHLSSTIGKKFQTQFLDAVAGIVSYTNNGAEIFSSRTYEDLIGSLPKEHQSDCSGVRAVFRPLEVQFGVREPTMGYGK